MMEMLLTTIGAGGGGYYPNSGPGSKYLLMGDEDLGYFGDIGNDLDLTSKTLNLILSSETSPFIDLTPSQDNSWLKFFFKGKTMYTPRRPIAVNVSHSELYESGMAFPYGKEFAYTFSNFPNTAQDAIVNAIEGGNSYSLNARLMRAFSTDADFMISGVTFPTIADITAKNSEMYNLLFRLLGQVNDGKEFPTLPLVSVSAYANATSNYSNTWASEVTVGNRSGAMRYYNTLVANYNGVDVSTKTTTTFFFRPILEYLPDTPRVMTVKKTKLTSVVPQAVAPWCVIDAAVQQPPERVITLMREQPEWQITPYDATDYSVGQNVVVIGNGTQPNWPIQSYFSNWTDPV